jgi:hypothetical protein
MELCMYTSLDILYKPTAWVAHVRNFIFHVICYQVKEIWKKRHIAPWDLWEIPEKFWSENLEEKDYI